MDYNMNMTGRQDEKDLRGAAAEVLQQLCGLALVKNPTFLPSVLTVLIRKRYTDCKIITGKE